MESDVKETAHSGQRVQVVRLDQSVTMSFTDGISVLFSTVCLIYLVIVSDIFIDSVTIDQQLLLSIPPTAALQPTTLQLTYMKETNNCTNRLPPDCT